MISAYLIHLFILVGIYVVLALSLQIAMGYTGLLNLGHIAFYGIGAYTSALLALAGYPFWFAFLMAGIISGVFGFLLAVPTHKLRGDYLALVTLGFSFIFYAVALNWTDLTRGPLGLPGIPKPELVGINFGDNIFYLLLVVAVAGISYLVLRQITRSPFGRVMQAVRDDELAVKILGKNTFLIKAWSLAISAFFAGIAGSLYAHYITFIDPSSFSLMQLIPVISMVIVGGLASLEGAIVAAALFTLLPEPLRFTSIPSSILGPMRQILYAVILLAIMIFKPRGFMGKIELE